MEVVTDSSLFSSNLLVLGVWIQIKCIYMHNFFFFFNSPVWKHTCYHCYCCLPDHQPWVWIHQLFRSVLNIEQNSKVIKGSIKCSIPVSSQVPLSNQQDEEVAMFPRQFKTRLAILKKNNNNDNWSQDMHHYSRSNFILEIILGLSNMWTKELNQTCS